MNPQKTIQLLTLALAVLTLSHIACDKKDSGSTNAPASQSDNDNTPGDTTPAPEETKAEASVLADEVKDETKWWERDFKVEYEYRPGVATSIITGKSSGTVRNKVVRVGDVIYRHAVTPGKPGDYNYLYRMEGGQVIMYLFNPQKKEAGKGVFDATDLNAAMRRLFKDNLAADLSSKMEKQRTDTFAGVDCDVYVLKSQTDQSEAMALANLAKRMGGKDITGQIQGMQMSGARSVWVSRKDGINMWANVQSNMQGKQSTTDQWKVSLFQTQNIDPREVAYNMNEYKVENLNNITNMSNMPDMRAQQR